MEGQGQGQGQGNVTPRIHPASNSADSDTKPKIPKSEVDGPSEFNQVESKPAVVKSLLDSDSESESDSDEEMEKYAKYEADYTRRLNAKYFSNKDIYGGIIFNEKTTINDQTIKSSRWPGTRSFADPMQAFEDQSSSSPTSTEESPTVVSNGQHSSKKSE